MNIEKESVILYIDDDPDDFETVALACKELGIKNGVVSKRTAEEALQFLQTEPPPFLILCDYKLPKMDGIALRKKIEADEHLRAKAIPFVFLSTTVSKTMVKEVYTMNVQGLFEKGYRFEEIKELLQQIYTYWAVCKHPNN
jgi:CheY-like chemotaxis protein